MLTRDRRLGLLIVLCCLVAAPAPTWGIRLAERWVDDSWGPAYLDLLGYLQPRIEFVDDDTACPAAADECEPEDRIRENRYGGDGFSLRRARIGVRGRLHRLVGIETLIELAGPPALLDAFVDLPIDPVFQLRLGQFKTPFSRQQMVPESRLQMIEYSLLVDGGIPDRNPSHLGVPGRDIGIMMTNSMGDGRMVELYTGVFNGDGANVLHNDDDGKLIVVRLETHPFGAPGRLEESDVAREDVPRLTLGLDFATNRRGGEGRRDVVAGPAFEERTNLFGADLAFFYGGISLYGEMLYRNWKTEDPEESNEVGFGFALQGGVLLPFEDFDRDIELTFRYDRYDPVRCRDFDCSDPAPGEPELEEPLDAMDPELGRRTFTVGMNFFFTGDHTWKLQMNYLHALETEKPTNRPRDGLDDDAFLVQMTAHL